MEGTDVFYYVRDGDMKIGNEQRNTLGTGPKFDFYLRKDVDVLYSWKKKGVI